MKHLALFSLKYVTIHDTHATVTLQALQVDFLPCSAAALRSSTHQFTAHHYALRLHHHFVLVGFREALYADFAGDLGCGLWQAAAHTTAAIQPANSGSRHW